MAQHDPTFDNHTVPGKGANLPEEKPCAVYKYHLKPNRRRDWDGRTTCPPLTKAGKRLLLGYSQR